MCFKSTHLVHSHWLNDDPQRSMIIDLKKGGGWEIRNSSVFVHSLLILFCVLIRCSGWQPYETIIEDPESECLIFSSKLTFGTPQILVLMSEFFANMKFK